MNNRNGLEKLWRMTERLRKTINNTQFMNEDRHKKLKYLLEIMEDVLLEEEITRAFFKDIRGGESV